MAQKTEGIDVVDAIVANWLDDSFEVKSVQEFNGNLKLLIRKLKTRHYSQKIGMPIDNLEPALGRDGKFIEKHRGYAELLKILADSQVQSLTLITSRETLREEIYNIQKYTLDSLSVKSWKKFFESKKINADYDGILKEINQAYGGNAQAMRLIYSQILLSPKENTDDENKPADLNQYLRISLIVCNNSSICLGHDRDYFFPLICLNSVTSVSSLMPASCKIASSFSAARFNPANSAAAGA
jgi:hypothetical protein